VTILTQQRAEDLFLHFDKATQLLQHALKSSYLDALLENAENLVDNGKVQVEDGKPNSAEVKQLEAIYQALNIGQQSNEDIRRMLQLSLLKVLHQDAIQANHQLTPDSLGVIIAYLLERVAQPKEKVTILDPVVGTGNLLTTVMNHLHQVTGEPVEGYGVDNDDSMLAVASVSAALQKLDVTLYHQDAVEPLTVPQVQMAVADLPIGYYPLDKNTKNYRTRAKKGHSYAHHLLIEQTINYLVPGGWAVFLVPANMFQTKETAGFVKWIQSVAHMQGLLNLPTDLFHNKAAEKSLLLLQKQGGGSRQTGKVLLGTFPTFNKQDDFRRFIGMIDQWVATNVKK
jgi:site-specific DNA-methyltransferase (adenine-specific)